MMEGFFNPDECKFTKPKGFWQSKNTKVDPICHSPKVQKLYDRLNKTTDPDKREQIIQDIVRAE